VAAGAGVLEEHAEARAPVPRAAVTITKSLLRRSLFISGNLQVGIVGYAR
jgi:hypothetical protein